MRVVVVGLGVQGKKRLRVAGDDVHRRRRSRCAGGQLARHRGRAARPATTRPSSARPTRPRWNCCAICSATASTRSSKSRCWADGEAELRELQDSARKIGALCYTAYNHRFEPHFVRDARPDRVRRARHRSIAAACSTATAPRGWCANSAWRDQGAGVLPDLGSHLLDTARFWFGDLGDDFRLVSASRFENRAPDHVVIASETTQPAARTRNDAAVVAQSFHLRHPRREGHRAHRVALQMGAEHLHARTRILPSGRPPEEAVTLVQDDPTWALEYAHFKQLCAAGTQTDLGNDLWLHRVLRRAAARPRPGTPRMSTLPKIGFAGMTHLGLVSAVAAASKGFDDARLRSPIRRSSRDSSAATCRCSSRTRRSAARPSRTHELHRRQHAACADATSSMSRPTCRPTITGRSDLCGARRPARIGARQHAR